MLSIRAQPVRMIRDTPRSETSARPQLSQAVPRPYVYLKRTRELVSNYCLLARHSAPEDA